MMHHLVAVQLRHVRMKQFWPAFTCETWNTHWARPMLDSPYHSPNNNITPINGILTGYNTVQTVESWRPVNTEDTNMWRLTLLQSVMRELFTIYLHFTLIY